MRVLVTGAAGFIGSHVVRKFIREGHTVYGVIRKNTSKERITDCIDRIHMLEVDLREVDRVRSAMLDIRPDCAIHLAWYAAPGKFWTATENLDCVEMSLSLARGLADAGCKRLLVAGTCAEYDWRYGFLSETLTPCEPQTLYGAAKHGLRLMLEQFCRVARMEFAWPRFFFLYGPGEQRQRLVPSVILRLLYGQKLPAIRGEQIRDFLHVEDAAAAVIAVAESGLTGSVNIGSGQPVQVRTIVETVAQIVSCSDRIIYGDSSADLAEPPMVVADVHKLKTHTQWRPYLTLNAGLQKDRKSVV